MNPLRVGIVGAGNISGIYLKNFALFPNTKVVAIADLDLDRAKAVAAEKNVPNALSTEELLNHPDVDLVLNITIPAAHYDVALAALKAGKHVYNEKPLSITREEAQTLLTFANEKGLRIGCAPDTFLGAGHQTARELIDQGVIGTPVAVQGFMTYHGPEAWHPSPHFFYKKGAGPLMDMGPYYLTAFVTMFGPIRRATSAARITFPQRVIGSEPFKGQLIDVETPTYIGAVMDFESGLVGQLTTSFDNAGFPGQPNIVVYGNEGCLIVPDPNQFNQPLKLIRKGKDPEEITSAKPFKENSRGLGVLDIAYGLNEGRSHRASGELAFHVLDAMLSILQGSEEGRFVELTSRPDRPSLIGEGEFAAERTLLG